MPEADALALSQAQIAWFRLLLERHRLTHHAELLLPWLEPCVGIETYAAETCPPGSSRLGALPDWPPGWDWPHAPDGGQPMICIAQLNLAELAHLITPLPKHGLLYVFWDRYRQPGHCRICWYQGDIAALRPIRRPLALADFVMELLQQAPGSERVCRLNFHAALSLPCSGEFDRCLGERLPLEDEAFDAYLSLGEALMGDWQHYLFGYHFSHGSLRDFGEPEGPPRGTTLLCLYGDETLDIDYNSLGPLQLLIDKAALAAGDFSRIRIGREAG